MADVTAAVRIRPAARSGAPPLSIKGQYGSFAFDYVIEETGSQEEGFNVCILPSVQNFLQGISAAVLCYGASSTGKSWTLEGGPASSRSEGAIPRALHAICKNLALVPKHRYKLYVTYCALSAGVEAHMVDLLAPGSLPVSLKDGSATTALARLLHYQVESHQDIYEVLRQGRMTRAAAFTGAGGSPQSGGNANRAANRPSTAAAHVMLNIQLTGFAASGEQLATNLTFVELAAPEAKDMMGYPSSADGGVTRALSLAYASLSGVITALRAGGGGGGSGAGRSMESPPRRGHTHVPWRDSPLTRWLKGCLGGAGSILVIATVAPGPEAAADTLATLSYVNRLRSGPKTDGLIVTATWDTGNGSAPGFEAAAAQQELQHSLHRATQAQRERQERELLAERDRDRERRGGDRFGSPIQVRGSPASAAASSMRPQSHGRYSPPTQMAPSLDTRYTTAPASVTSHSHRSASVPRGMPRAAVNSGAPSAAGATMGGTAAASIRSSINYTPQATPTSGTPRSGSYLSSPRHHHHHHDEEPQDQQHQHQEMQMQPPPPSSVQPLRTSDVLAGSSARAPSAAQAPLSSLSRQQSQRSSQALLPLQAPSQAASQSQGRHAPLSELLASLQLGGTASQHSEPQLQPQPLGGVEGSSLDEGSFAGGSTAGHLGAGSGPGIRGAAGGGGSGVGGSASGGGVNAAIGALGRQVEQLRAELGAERRETQRLKAEVSSLESANRTAGDVAEAHAALSLAEARGHVDSMRKQLETSEGAKQVLVRRVQQLQQQQGSVMDLQAESSVLEAQVRALQDGLDAARSAHSSMAGQLADARAAADALRQDRDRLQLQNHDLSDKLQAQVRALSEETSRLRTQAMDAAGQVEAEQVARRAAEAALAQVRVQVEGSRGAEGSALQQAAALAAQMKELSGALEAVRGERNKLQEAKWRSDERAEQLGLELDSAMTQRAKQDMEARAAATKADSDLRSAIVAAEGLKVEVSGARAQVDSLKQELRAAQLAAEDAGRRESSVHTDVQEMEALMRELDRDLEVQVNTIWRQLRSERADSLFGVPEAGAVPPARRWRPVLQALVGIVKRSANEAERQAQALEQARERSANLESQVARTNELATSLAAHQQIKAAHLAELEESRRSIALMDQALAEANRECQRLHHQLEEATAAHRAFKAESSAREARMQAQAAERETTLQSQVSDREDRLRSATAEHEKRMAALAAEWEGRLHSQVSDRDARLRAAVMEADAKLQSIAAEREARVSAAVADGEARLMSVVAERDARLQQTISDADSRFHEAVSEREDRLSALAQERELLSRQLAAISAVQGEDKQERDILRLRAHGRDQLLNIVWSEVRAVRMACLSSGASSPPRTPGFGGGASIVSQSSSPAMAGLMAAAEHEGAMDWGEPMCQERLLKGLTTVRVQVGKLQAEAGALRANAGLSEELGGQLGSARSRLAEAQRSVEQLTSRLGALEEDLREEQQARSSLQQQLASSEAAASAMQSSLSEARQTMASLQEEAAVLSKSRDTWKDTATQQEAQLREMYSDGELRAGELARLRGEAQSATTEASGASGRVRLLESQLQDVQHQAETLAARLSATDKALGEANMRAASLNGQLVLAESEARLKAQELLSRAQAAEDGEKLAKSNAKEAMDRLEGRLREASEQGSKLVADLDTLRVERTEAQLKADDLQRQLLENRARLVDAEHVAKQLHKVMGERDALQEQLNGLRNAHAQADNDARSLRRQLDTAQEQLQRLGEEKTRLAAQIEGQRLEAIMANMAPRTGGRIGALARPGGEAAGMGADAQRSGAAGSYPRSYSGLTYPAAGGYGGPSVGASPTLARGSGAYGAAGMQPFSPTGTATTSGSLYGDSLRLGAPSQGAGGYGAGPGLGGGGAAGDPMAVRVHIQTSPQ